MTLPSTPVLRAFPAVEPDDRRHARVAAAFRGFLEALGLSHSKASDKKVPWAIEQAPSEVVAAFLRGLFDADGCVYNGEDTRYVGLGSSSKDLLKGTQRLLSTFGIFSRHIYEFCAGAT